LCVAFVIKVMKVCRGGAEANLEAERAEDLEHHHVGALEVVGRKEVELCPAGVGVNMAAVVPEITTYAN
jgi:hypothetical protein